MTPATTRHSPLATRGERRRAAVPTAALALLLAVAGCATGPQERRVHAQFACDDGRKLDVTFLPDSGQAVLHMQEVQAPMKAEPSVPGRAFAGGGYELHGVGDTVTFTSPPSTRCEETR